MLSSLVAWIEGTQEDFPFENQSLTLSYFEKEQAVEQQNHKQLIAKVRVAWFSKRRKIDTSHTSLPEAQDVEKHLHLLNFIEFGKKELTAIVSDSLFSLALKYCLSLLAENKEATLVLKSTHLFMVLLHEDKTKTLKFYEENKSLFKDCEGINRQVAKELAEIKMGEAVKSVETYLAFFSEELAEQKNALGISALFNTELYDVEKFAALLLWLLQQGVSSRTILRTNLLHNFLRYHLFTLDQEESAIRQLYRLLAQFPEAKKLVVQAGKVSCDERGFESYSLDGVLHREEELLSVQVSDAPLDFTPTEENFAALSKLFGQPFLVAAVITPTEPESQNWLNALKRSLNHESMLTKELPALINLIAVGQPAFLKELAKLIEESTVEQLISLNSGAILHLLPYKPALFEKIKAVNVEKYIQQLNSSDASGLDVIAQLLVMLTVFLKHNHPSAGQVFDAIIEKLFDNSHLIDDIELLRQLKRYPGWAIHLARRSAQLQRQLEECIARGTEQSSLTIESYQLIEDTWFEVSRKLQTLTYLNSQPKFDFYDKYTLYIRIAQACFNKQGSAFDINAFIELLPLQSPTQPSEDISEYERVLVEILTAIDDELIRDTIIDKLEAAPIQRRNWWARDYGGETVFLKAARQGNLGLLTNIAAIKQQSKPVMNKALLLAAEVGHWPVVNYLCADTIKLFTRRTIYLVLMQAAEQGELTAVGVFCNDDNPLPPKKILEKALEGAITNNHINVVRYLCQLTGNSFSKEVIERGFRLAAKLEHWDLAEYFCSLPVNAPSQLQIEKMFEQAAETNCLELAKRLYRLENNAPRQLVIDRVMNKMARVGNLEFISYFCGLKDNPLSRTLIESALIEAAANGHLPLVNYLSNLELNKPSPQVQGKALQASIKAGKQDVIAYFCSLPTNRFLQGAVDFGILSAVKSQQATAIEFFCHLSNPPSRQGTENALQAAIKLGDTAAALYLCNLPTNAPSQRIVEQGLLTAVKGKQIAMVQGFCSLLSDNKPRKAVLELALRKASTTKQIEIVDYLREVLGKPRIIRRESGTKLDGSLNRQLDSYGIFGHKQHRQAHRKITKGSDDLPVKDREHQLAESPSIA
ncbi:hypothetical protein [Legionella sp. 29fVS95]|uniref:hypothetical protein n=1 Tax=Legionella sp. 29fVS95 TaxID=3402813 RepID=UPI003AF8E897